jgi:hypothetical protein
MQLGAVLVFDAGPLTLRNGGIDVERLRAYTAERLPELPRSRQRRVELALGRLAYFAEDPSFQLDYHVRHASLPRPGDERALKRLAGRVFSQALDPDKPLWELWVVEGLEEGRFALIAKLDSAWSRATGAATLPRCSARPSPASRPRRTLAGVGVGTVRAAGAALRPASLSRRRGARSALAGGGSRAMPTDGCPSTARTWPRSRGGSPRPRPTSCWPRWRAGSGACASGAPAPASWRGRPP